MRFALMETEFIAYMVSGMVDDQYTSVQSKSLLEYFKGPHWRQLIAVSMTIMISACADRDKMDEYDYWSESLPFGTSDLDQSENFTIFCERFDLSLEECQLMLKQT